MWTAEGRAAYDRVDAWAAAGNRTIPLDLLRMGLTELPPLPDDVLHLNCSHNKLTTLQVVLPHDLLILDCGDNELVALPDLPPKLLALHAVNCLLEALPALPPTLLYLLCGNNNLRTLPALPMQLETLSCYGNKLRALPALPPSLTTLVFCNTEISRVPPLPAGLVTLSWGPLQPTRPVRAGRTMPARDVRLAPIRRMEMARIVVYLPPALQRLAVPGWDWLPDRAPPELQELYVGADMFESASVFQAKWSEVHAAARRRLGAYLPPAAMLFV